MLYGAFLSMAETLRSDGVADTAALWRRRGKRAFAAEALPGDDCNAIGAP